MLSFLRFSMLTLAAAGLLMACSSPPKYKGVYDSEQEQEQQTSLVVPPDLDKPVSSDDALPVAGIGNSSYLSVTEGDNLAGQPVASLGNDVYHLKRDGSLRWLEIRQPVARVWQDARLFFEKLGFKIEGQERRIGVFETSWLENRVNLPTNWLSKMLRKLYSAGLMDKYRVRVESGNSANTSLLFISHQGLKETAAGDDSDVVETAWEPRASDPELEFEMLQRFMLFQGAGDEVVETISKVNRPVERAHIASRDDGKVLVVDEAFPRTWRRIGIALDRMGLKVEDKNRSSGLYYIRLTRDFRDRELKQQGWFDRLFGGDNDPGSVQYLINVKDLGQKSEVSIYQAQGGQKQQEVLDVLYGKMEQYLK